MTTKILFLDVDGVLNSETWFRSTRCVSACSRAETFAQCSEDEAYALNQLDPDAVKRLSKICDATACKIVLSSMWRLHTPLPQMTKLLHMRGLRKQYGILDYTPDMTSWSPRAQILSRASRGDEVAAWLANHGKVDAFIAIDDDEDFGRLKSHLVLTRFLDGLTEDKMTEAIYKLTSCQNDS
jgi:hypothetical protein